VSGWTNEKVCLPFSPILSHTYEFLLIFRFDFAYSRVPWRADPDELSRGKIALVLAREIVTPAGKNKAVRRGTILRCRPSIFPISKKLKVKLKSGLFFRRELEVLQAVAAGKSNKEIGVKLFISEGAVKSHVKSLLEKLAVPGRTAAIREAVHRGLVRLN